LILAAFLAPARLWLLLGVIALAAVYVAVQRRRPRHAVRFTNLELLASVAPANAAWRRHVPAALTLAALALLVVSFARPTRAERVPQETATLVLAIDTSLSMGAEDVEPDRLQAAQAAATSFVEDLPPHIRLGLVSFDGTARIHVTPTLERAPVLDAIANLVLGPGTATGEAVFTSLDAIGPEAEGEAARIVLMSDGKLTVGRPAELAVAAADEAGVSVSTIAFGTDEGQVFVQGQIIPVPVDREALESMADATGGTYSEAASSDELRRIYEGIGRTVGYEVEQQEITALLVGFGVALLTLGAGGSLLWSSRLP
jgi:Ca-activated chloride channel family protein